MQYPVKLLLSEIVTHNVKRFIIEKPKDFHFTPGQATDLTINQPGFRDKKNPFTFTSLNKDLVLEFVIKGYRRQEYPDHAGVTEKVHQLQPGDELLITEAWGAISYQGPGIFIAGGAGITPFLAIFKDLFYQNKLKGNKLIFSNRTQADIIMEKELRVMFGYPDSLYLTLTQQQKAGYLHGRLDEKLIRKITSDFKQPFYICGPKPMVKNLKSILIRLGAKPDLLVFEK